MPDLVIVSNAEEHNSTVMDSLITDEGSIYIFDKAYVNYEKFDNFTGDNKFFITRLKDNSVTTIEKELEVTYSKPHLLDKDIELFFKWIKQHLKIKNFIGHSYNGVMIQLTTGIITYILLKLITKEAYTLAYDLLKIKRKTIFPVKELLKI